MNTRMIARSLGLILLCLAVLLLLPLIAGLYYGESVLGFIVTIAISAAAAFVLTRFKPESTDISAREGFVIVGMGWILLSAIGALPFVISGDIPNYIDALFETASGLTTTGATIMTDIEAMSRGGMFWRMFTHWIGGMGVLVFIMAVMPMNGAHSMHLMRAEVPGPTVGKLVPRVRQTARILYLIYFALTIIEAVLLRFGGMSNYDALLHAFANAGTGGFSTRAASIAAFDSVYIEMVIAVFMLIFSVNFNLYYLILIGHVGEALRSEELRWYLIITGVSTALIAADIYEIFGTVGESVRYAFFQVTSVMSTTGFATSDYNAWPALSKVILALLMFCGACVGSTTGGIKVGRIILLVKSGLREVKYMLHPRAVVAVRSEGKPVERDVLRGANSYMIVYIMLFTVSLFLVEMVEECDLVTWFTAVSACLNNVGPGLGEVGPAGNFSALTPFTKILLSVDMLAGRLEIFPLLMLFAPSTWRGR